MTDFVQAHPDGLVLSMDEMSLYLQATLSRVWFPVGQRPKLRISPQRDCLHFYGALNWRTGQDVSLPLPVLNAQATVHFLRHLLACFPTQPLLLVLDRAPWHRGEPIRQFLAANPRLELIYFPPACPELNPQEHVWKQARQAVSHNHTFTRLGQLRHAFSHFLDTTRFEIDILDNYAPPIMWQL